MIGAAIQALGVRSLLATVATVAIMLGVVWGVKALRDNAVQGERLRQIEANDKARSNADAAEDRAKGCAGEWDRVHGRCLSDSGSR